MKLANKISKIISNIKKFIVSPVTNYE